MLIRVASTLLALIAAVHGVAIGVFFWLGGGSVEDYGSMVILCSIGLGLLGGAFCNAPSGASGYEGQMTAMHRTADFESHDRADRESALSLGLVVFAAAFVAGCTGYLLTRV